MKPIEYLQTFIIFQGLVFGIMILPPSFLFWTMPGAFEVRLSIVIGTFLWLWFIGWNYLQEREEDK